MTKYWALKEGKQYNVYTAPADFDSRPEETNFLGTFDDRDGPLLTQLRCSQAEIIIKTKPSNNTVSAPPSPEQLAAHSGSLGVSAEKLKEMLQQAPGAEVDNPRHPSNLQPSGNPMIDGILTAFLKPTQPPVNLTGVLERAMQEFKVVVAGGNPEEIEYVGSFLIAVEPQLEPELLKITQERKKRFKLG